MVLIEHSVLVLEVNIEGEDKDILSTKGIKGHGGRGDLTNNILFQGLRRSGKSFLNQCKTAKFLYHLDSFFIHDQF